MGMKFVGGPYDGMEIDHTVMNRHAQIVPVTGDLGTRLFVFMPPRASWEILVRREPAATEPRVIYERAFAPDGAHFELASNTAFGQAQLAASLKVHPRARTALASLSEEDQRSVVTAAAALQGRDPNSWPSRQVSRLGPDKDLFLLQVSPDLRVFIRIAEQGRVELFDIVREETLRLFLERYRSGSKVG